MTAIFAGLGTGLGRGSASVLGSAGLIGSATNGRGLDKVMVNATTGNLVISRQDEFVAGKAVPASVERTYNSLTTLADDNNDKWRQSNDRRVYGLTGTVNTAGSTVKRVSGDGTETTYTWDATVSAYVSKEGGGSYDTIVRHSNGTQWLWTDGALETFERYNYTLGRLDAEEHLQGASTLYSYDAQGRMDKATTSDGSWIRYDWVGTTTNLEKLTTGYTDYTPPTPVAKTLTRVRYTYDGSNRLLTVKVDLSPEDNVVTDNKYYLTTYTYDASGRVSSITDAQHNGTTLTEVSKLTVAYDASGRVTELNQDAGSGQSRITRIGYGVYTTSITGPDGEVTRLWYDNKGQLLQIMTPPSTKGGPSQVQQFEYYDNGDLKRTIETDSDNASVPTNLVKAAGWGDGEEADRGDNLVDDGGWPQDVDGTLPANGTIGTGWTSSYISETQWVSTTGPYGTGAVVLRAGQNDSAGGAGGGAQSTPVTIDPTKSYEFTYYFRLNAAAVHPIYFGGPDIWTGAAGYVDHAHNGQNQINPYFLSLDAATQNNLFQTGKWYKVVGYVLPEGSANITQYSMGGVYDTQTGDKVTVAVETFRWSPQRTANISHTRFFNYYGTDISKQTDFFKPGMREVANAAILRGNEKLDIVKDRNLVEAALAPGWTNVTAYNSDNEARWNEVVGPDGSMQVALQTGQFDTGADGGGGVTNTFTVDPTKAYRFTQYVRKSDLTRHYIYSGLNTAGATPYVKYAVNGADAPNPYFLQWSDDTQRAYLQEDRWYKIVGYVLPQGSANIASYNLGGVFDAVTGTRVADLYSFRWHESMPNNQVYARYFTFYDETQPGWSTDWLAPEVVQVSNLTADNAAPFGVTYDEGGRITTYSNYTANGEAQQIVGPSGRTITRTYGSVNRTSGNVGGVNINQFGANIVNVLLSETTSGVDLGSGAASSETTRFVYDVRGYVRYKISPEGRVTEYTWNWGRVTSEIDYAVAYTTAGTPTESTMNTWRNGLDRSGVQETIYGYDARMNLSSTSSYGEHSSTGAGTVDLSQRYEVYDQAGRLLKSYASGFSQTSYIYDGLGRITSTTDAYGATTTFTFNNGALTTTVAMGVNGYVKTSTYNKAGDLVSDADNSGLVVPGSAEYTNDRLGRVRMVVDHPSSSRTHITYKVYDNSGRLAGIVDQSGYLTEYQYDNGNRLIGTVSWHTAISSTSLAALANPNNTLAIADFRPSGGTFTASWTVYDNDGKVVQEIDGAGRVTGYTYDGSGRLIQKRRYATAVSVSGFQLTPPVAAVTVSGSTSDEVVRTFYDKDGLLVGTLDAEGYLTQNFYDSASRLVTTTTYATRTSTTLSARLTSSFATLVSWVGTSGQDRTSRFVYDGRGLLRFTIDAARYVTEHVYAGGIDKVARTYLFKVPLAGSVTTYSHATVQAAIAPQRTAADTRVTYYTYDSTGRLAYTVDPEGAVIGYKYDGVLRIERTIQFASKSPQSSQPSTAGLDATVNINDADNRVSRTWYDERGDATFTVDGENVISQSVYARSGRLYQTIIFDDKATGVTDTTTALQIFAQVNQNARTLTAFREWDSLGRLIQYHDPASNGGATTYTSYTYFGSTDLVNTATRIANGSTADQSVEQYTYDASGTAQSHKVYKDGALFATATTNVNARGDLQSSTDFNTNTTSYTYDLNGRMKTSSIQVTNAQGTTTTLTTEYEYNAFGQVWKVKDPNGNYTYTWYDKLGRVTTVRDAQGYITTTEYTDFGEVWKVRRWSGTVSGTADVATEPAGPGAAAITSFTYDRMGRVLSTTDAVGNAGVAAPAGQSRTEFYTYNAFGERETVTNRLGAVTTYKYDRRGQLKRESVAATTTNTPGGGAAVAGAYNVKTYDYDVRGNVKQTIEGYSTTAGGTVTALRTTNYLYDAANRVTRVTRDLVTHIEDNMTTTGAYTPTEQYTYDSRGNLILSVSGGSADGGLTISKDAVKTWSYYDDLDRKTAEIRQVDATTGVYTAYTYDFNGNLSSIKVFEGAAALPASPGGSAPGAPTSPTANFRETKFTYDALDRMLTSKVIGTTVGNTVTSGSWNTSTSTWVSAAEDLITTYTYDGNGNVVKLVDPNGNATWSWYDALGRKTDQIDALGYRTRWGYDSEGNVLQEYRYWTPGATPAANAPLPIPLPALPATNANDRITNYEYDLNGSRRYERRTGVAAWTVDASTGALTAAGTTSEIEYQYNALGQVWKKIVAGVQIAEYTYHSTGRLDVEKRAAFTDANGVAVTPTTNYGYDALGNLYSTTQLAGSSGTHAALARTTTNRYGEGGRLLSSTDAENKTRNYSYDVAGRLKKDAYTRTSAGAAIAEAQTTTYDLGGRALTKAVYSTIGGVFQKVDLASFKYNAFDQVTQQGSGTDSASGINAGNALYQVANKYDAAGRLVATSAGDGLWKLFGYDKNGNQTVAITSAGYALSGSTNFASALAIAVSTTDANAPYLNATFTAYDKRNLATRVVEEGRQLSSSVTQALTTDRDYTAFGDIASETKAVGTSLQAKTTYTYNTMGRMIRSEGPTVQMTKEDGTPHWIKPMEEYYYDLGGRLIATRDANGTYATGGNASAGGAKTVNTGNLTRLVLLAGTGYDGSQALVTKEFHADNGVKQTKYDIHGDVRVVIDELNRTIASNTYDRLGRLTTSTNLRGLADYYTYDELGQRVAHWNSLYTSSNQETTGYDALGRVTSTRAFGGDLTEISYTWSNTLAAPGSGLTNTGGWTTQTTYRNTLNSGTLVSTAQADVFGRVITRTDLDGRLHNFQYDVAGRMTKTHNNIAGYAEINYSYYNTGLVRGQIGNAPETAYQYDALGRKTFESVKSYNWQNGVYEFLKQATVTYDGMGRIVQYEDLGGPDMPYAKLNYSYDSVGNVRSTTSLYYTLNLYGDPVSQLTSTKWNRYDTMDRMVVADGDLSGGQIVRGITGVGYTYDVAGQRTQQWTTGTFQDSATVQFWYDGHWETHTYSYQADVREDFVYDSGGGLYQVNSAHGYLDYVTWFNDAQFGGTYPQSYYISAPGTGQLQAEFTNDDMGRVTRQRDFVLGTAQTVFDKQTTYNTKGQVSFERTDTRIVNDIFRSDATYAYLDYDDNYALGQVGSIDTTNYKNSNNAQANDTLLEYRYDMYDKATLSQSIYTPNKAAPGTLHYNNYQIDSWGYTRGVTITDGRPRSVVIKHDENNQILSREEDETNYNRGNPRQIYYRFDGRQLGEISNDGTSNVGYTTSVAQRGTAQPASPGPFRSGSLSASSHSDFNQHSDVINSYQQSSSTRSSYTVQAGDTLQSIAASVWGDASLWYKIAQQNGLTDSSALNAGQTLALPSGVVRSHNNANTFKAYDPGKALGDISPTAVKPVADPAKKAKCGVFGQVLSLVVAVAASYLLGPIGGNLVSQGFNNLIGLQKGFSWKSLGLSVLSAGVASGVGAALGSGAMFGSQFAGDVIRGAASSAITQGVATATGLQDNFSWAGVAAAGIGAGVGGAMTRALSKGHYAQGSETQSEFHGSQGWNEVSYSDGSWMPDGNASFGAQLAGSAASAIASAATRSAIAGESFGRNLVAAIPDVIGQAVGGALGRGLGGSVWGGKNHDGVLGILQDISEAPTKVGQTVGAKIGDLIESGVNDVGSLLKHGATVGAREREMARTRSWKSFSAEDSMAWYASRWPGGATARQVGWDTGPESHYELQQDGESNFEFNPGEVLWNAFWDKIYSIPDSINSNIDAWTESLDAHYEKFATDFQLAEEGWEMLFASGVRPVEREYVLSNPSIFKGTVITRSLEFSEAHGVLEVGEFVTDQVTGKYIVLAAESMPIEELYTLPDRLNIRQQARNFSGGIGVYENINLFSGYDVTTGISSGIANYTVTYSIQEGGLPVYAGHAVSVGAPKSARVNAGVGYTFIYDLKAKPGY